MFEVTASVSGAVSVWTFAQITQWREPGKTSKRKSILMTWTGLGCLGPLISMLFLPSVTFDQGRNASDGSGAFFPSLSDCKAWVV